MKGATGRKGIRREDLFVAGALFTQLTGASLHKKQHSFSFTGIDLASEATSQARMVFRTVLMSRDAEPRRIAAFNAIFTPTYSAGGNALASTLSHRNE